MKSDYVRLFFRISTIILCMLATSACEDIVDGGYFQVAVYMEVYDSDGNNLLDESNDNNIVGTTIKYVREDQGSTYRVSWTGKEDNWSVINPGPWKQILYVKDLKSLKLYDNDCSADFKYSYKLMLGEPEQVYDISIRHIGKKDKTEATVNGKKVPVSENNEPFIFNNCRYDINHTFRLILPAKH